MVIRWCHVLTRWSCDDGSIVRDGQVIAPCSYVMVMSLHLILTRVLTWWCHVLTRGSCRCSRESRSSSLVCHFRQLPKKCLGRGLSGDYIFLKSQSQPDNFLRMGLHDFPKNGQLIGCTNVTSRWVRKRQVVTSRWCVMTPCSYSSVASWRHVLAWWSCDCTSFLLDGLLMTPCSYSSVTWWWVDSTRWSSDDGSFLLDGRGRCYQESWPSSPNSRFRQLPKKCLGRGLSGD